MFDDGLFDDDDDAGQAPASKKIEGGVGDFDHVLWLLTSVGSQPLGLMPVGLNKVPFLRQWTTREVVKCHDPDYLRARWAEFGEPNIGFVLGRDCGPGGTVVVDPDNEAGEDWCRENLPPSPTMVMAARGGHLLMAHPSPDGERVKNSTDVLGSKDRWHDELEDRGYDVRGRIAKAEGGVEGKELATIIKEELARALAKEGPCPYPLIDIKSDGGYSVAPGSRHQSGHVYKGVGFDPESWALRPTFDASLFPAKYKSKFRSSTKLNKDIEWLKSIARDDGEGGLVCDYDKRDCSQEEKLKRASAYLAKCDASISGAGGHDQLYFAACRLYMGFDLEFGQAFDLLKAEFNPRCQPEWADWELDHKLEQAAALASEPRGCFLINRADFQEQRSASATGLSLVPDPDPADFVPDEAERPEEPDADSADAYEAFTEVGVDYWQVLERRLLGHIKYRGGRPYVPVTINNLKIVLLLNPRFANTLKYNELRQKAEMGGQFLSDHDELVVREQLEFLFKANVPKESVRAAVDLACLAAAYDPILDYLDSVKWDGESRLWFIADKIFHTTKNPDLAAVMTAKFFLSAVARALRPGCKVDTALILKAGQGSFKSSFFEVMFGDWFTDADININDKDSLTLLATNWCWEWAELQHVTNPNKVTKVKGFMTQTRDQYRSPYDRHLRISPRRSVIVGTTNDPVLVYDDTGARRFWIVEVREKAQGGIDTRLAAQWRDQIWAEARDLVTAFWARDPDDTSAHDGQWWLSDDEDGQRSDAEADYRPSDIWTEKIADLAAGHSEPFTLKDILSGLEVDASKQNSLSGKRVSQVLEQIGYVSRQRRIGGARIRAYDPLPLDD
jgi:hypothetical protein